MFRAHTFMIVSGVSVLLCALAVAGYLYLRNPQYPQGDIVIGYVGDLSDTDPAIAQIRHATDLAVREINDEGGIRGHALRVVYEEGGCDGNTALESAQRLIRDHHVPIILGGICSSEIRGMKTITETAKVIVFSPSASSPEITHMGDFIFRTAPSDSILAAHLGRIARNHDRHIGIIAEQTDFAKAYADVFASQLDTVAFREDIDRDTTEYATLVKQVVSNSPDAVLLSTQEAGMARDIITALRAGGYTGHIYGQDYILRPFVETYSTSTEGIRFIQLNPDVAAPQAIHVTEALGTENTSPTDRYYMLGAYDIVHILSEAMRSVGLDTEKIRDHLSATTYHGALGTYRFDTNGDITIDSTPPYSVNHKVNGTIIELSN